MPSSIFSFTRLRAQFIKEVLSILRDPKRILAVMKDGRFAKAPAIAAQRAWGYAA